MYPIIYFIAETAKPIPDQENISGNKGIELSKTPVELKSGDWILKVVPWIGGRILSMQHILSGNVQIHRTFDQMILNSI